MNGLNKNMRDDNSWTKLSSDIRVINRNLCRTLTRLGIIKLELRHDKEQIRDPIILWVNLNKYFVKQGVS